jgi:very-short-patch-repair endonuclease
MRNDCRIDTEIWGRFNTRDLDALISWFANRQHGAVGRWQLLAAGAGARAIDHRVARGQLLPVHHGVYAVGHRNLSRLGRWMAAILACGPGALLSHCSAAALWGMRPSAATRIDVTIHGGPRKRAGIVVHRGALPSDEITEHQGIPVTTVSRTLLDLASQIGAQALECALREADVLRLTDDHGLEDLLARYPRKRGAKAIRAALTELQAGQGRTKRELEARFKSLLFAENLPRPEFNATLELDGTTIEPDCLWRKQRLIVELDSHAYHRTRAAFEADRERDRILTRAGYRVIRVTWKQLDRPKPVFADLRALLN